MCGIVAARTARPTLRNTLRKPTGRDASRPRFLIDGELGISSAWGYRNRQQTKPREGSSRTARGNCLVRQVFYQGKVRTAFTQSRDRSHGDSSGGAPSLCPRRRPHACLNAPERPALHLLTHPHLCAPLAAQSVQTFGRKKSAVAVSYCKKGRGLIKINGCPIELVEPELLRYKVFEPILLLGRERFAIMDLRIRVKGGGYTSQIYAIRQAIAKSVVSYYQKCAHRTQALATADGGSAQRSCRRPRHRATPPDSSSGCAAVPLGGSFWPMRGLVRRLLRAVSGSAGGTGAACYAAPRPRVTHCIPLYPATHIECSHACSCCPPFLQTWTRRRRRRLRRSWSRTTAASSSPIRADASRRSSAVLVRALAARSLTVKYYAVRWASLGVRIAALARRVARRLAGGEGGPKRSAPARSPLSLYAWCLRRDGLMWAPYSCR